MSFGPDRPPKGKANTTKSASPLHNFSPSRIVVLSQLSASEKEAYYQLILNARVKIHCDHHQQFIANVRLHDSRQTSSEDDNGHRPILSSGTTDKSTVNIDQRLRRLTHPNGSITSSHVASPPTSSHPLINVKVQPVVDSTHSSPKGHNNNVQSPFNYSMYRSFTLLISDDGYVAKPRYVFSLTYPINTLSHTLIFSTWLAVNKRYIFTL